MKRSIIFLLLAGSVILFTLPTWAAGKISPDVYGTFETHLDQLAARLTEYTDAGYLESAAVLAARELNDLSRLNEEILTVFDIIERELKGVTGKKTVQTALVGRHQDFVNHYRDKYAELVSPLTALKDVPDSAASKEILRVSVSSLISLIRESQVARYQPLDPNNLPVGQVSFGESGFKFPPLLSDGQSDYKSETPGVMFTEGVEELAESLKGNPVRMAQWVRDHIEFIPLYGSVKGSELCLLDRSGNDYDQASVLIALLRSSDIPARYVYGRIRVEDENLVSWLGVEDIKIARETIKSHGIPIKDGAFDHVWVEVYMENPSQWGIDGPPRWIPMDPSYKQYRLTRITQRVKDDLLENLSSSFFQPLGLPGPVMERKLSYTWARNKVHLPVDINLPYQVKERLWAGPTLGSEFAYRVEVALSRPGEDTVFSGEFPVEELARQPVSLLYLPAGFQDRAIMKALDNLTKNPDSAISFLPAYLVKVRPYLLVGNRIVLSGKPGGLGRMQNLSVTLVSPRFRRKTFRHTVLAGSQSAIRVMAGGMSHYSAFDDSTYGYTFKERLLKEPLEYLEQKLGTAFLNRIGMDYMSKGSQLRAKVAAGKGIVVNSFFSEGLVSRGVRAGYLLGRPASFEYNGVQLDIQADLVCAAYGDSVVEKNGLLAALGSYGSILEHSVLESASTEPTTAVSAMRVLSQAQQEGIPVKIFHPGDEKLLSYLPQPLKSEIIGALGRQQEVHIPQRPVKIGDWEGYGYILYDPGTGSRGYMINGLGAGFSGNMGANSQITMPKGTLAKFLMVILVLGVIVLIVLLI